MQRVAAETLSTYKNLAGPQYYGTLLRKGTLNIYPEYTGTIIQEILSGKNIENERELREELAKHGIKMSSTLGFNNTYALGMKKESCRAPWHREDFRSQKPS